MIVGGIVAVADEVEGQAEVGEEGLQGGLQLFAGGGVGGGGRYLGK